MNYLIILEPTATGYSAYSPDLKGCSAAGSGRAETVALMQEAIASHLSGLAQLGLEIPQPACEPAFVAIEANLALPLGPLPTKFEATASADDGLDPVELLKGSVIRYDDPFGPAVTEDEWEAGR